MWIAWLMVDRIGAGVGSSSFAVRNSGKLIGAATVCFHLRLATETFLGLIPLQMFFALGFVILWLFLCVNIIGCVVHSLRIMQKEIVAQPLQSSPGLGPSPLKVEAKWALTCLWCELAACLLSAVAVMWTVTVEIADQTGSLPMVIAYRINQLIKVVVTSTTALSGLMWMSEVLPVPCKSKGLLKSKTMFVNSEIWSHKVEELGNRGVTVLSLLSFWRQLLERQVMPSFDPSRSTTTDVVRLAIIPGTLDASNRGHAMASLWSGGSDVPAMTMVTHNWTNLFRHLMAAIFAHALEESYYQGVADAMLEEKTLQALETRIRQKPGCGLKTYWVCAFAVNQHASICNGFGCEPTVGTPEFERWDVNRRDTVSNDIYPVCQCCEPKRYNDEPDLCEMNKFDAMMRRLSDMMPTFSHLVVADALFEVFTRAWCIAEVVESGRCKIPQHIMVHSQATVDSSYRLLSSIDVQACEASRPEDKALILNKIEDVDHFNLALQFAIFGTEGLLGKFVDGLDAAQRVGRIVHRACAYGWHLDDAQASTCFSRKV